MLKTLFSEFKPAGLIKSDSKRLRYIDAAYFIGVFFVVLGHAHPLTEAWHNTWLRYMNGFIYSFHMHLYFFIAGYLLVHSKSIDKIGYKKWAIGKILKFGVPYLFLTVLAYLPKFLIGGTSDVVELSFSYFLRTTFLEPRDGVWGHFWFITAYLPIDLIWGLWRAYAPKNKWVYRIGLVVGFVVSLIIAILPINTKLFTLYDISEVAIFYCIGIVVALIKPFLWDKKYKLAIGILISSATVYFLFPYGNYMNYKGKQITLISLFESNILQFDLYQTTFFNFIVSLSLVWFCWCLAHLIGKIKWFTLPQKIAPYIFIIFIYGWPAQATLEAFLRYTNLHWFPISVIMFFVGYFAPIFIVMVYRKMKFLHCRFFDLLIGIDTNKPLNKERQQS